MNNDTPLNALLHALHTAKELTMINYKESANQDNIKEEDNSLRLQPEEFKFMSMLWAVANIATSESLIVTPNSCHPNQENIAKLLLRIRGDIEISINPDGCCNGLLVISPVGFHSSSSYPSTYKLIKADEPVSEEQIEPTKKEQPTDDTRNVKQGRQPTQQETQQETPPNPALAAVKKEILERYPFAKSTDKGISVGDVIICHSSVPATLVTTENIAAYSKLSGYFIIAKCG